MFCEYCGKQIDDNSNFCGFCGKTTEETEPPVISEPIVRGRILFVLEMLMNVAAAVSPFIKMFDVTFFIRFQFSFAGIVDAIDPVKSVLDMLKKLGFNFDFLKKGSFGVLITVVLAGAAAAMLAGYVFLVLSIVSLGKRRSFSSSRLKSAISLACFLASYALDYLAIFLINSKISSVVHFDISLFGANVWYYIFAAGAAAGIILSFCCKRRARV